MYFEKSDAKKLEKHFHHKMSEVSDSGTFIYRNLPETM